MKLIVLAFVFQFVISCWPKTNIVKTHEVKIKVECFKSEWCCIPNFLLPM